jgi:hypothetical protein
MALQDLDVPSSRRNGIAGMPADVIPTPPPRRVLADRTECLKGQWCRAATSPLPAGADAAQTIPLPATTTSSLQGMVMLAMR